MKTRLKPGDRPATTTDELEAAVQRAASNVRDPAAMRRASERMDSIREENRWRFGADPFAVDAVRDVRDA